MLPQEFIDRVKDATDIVKLVKRYTEINPAGGGVWAGKCPNPRHDDSDPSFRVWEKEKSWACMGCHNGRKNSKDRNYGSDCFAFLQWMSHGKMNWRQAVLKLADEAGIPLPDDKNQKVYDQKKLLAKSLMKNLQGIPLNYLKSRGVDSRDIDRWIIGCDGPKIVFPLLDRYKNVLGFTRRWMDETGKEDKYRNSPTSSIFNKSYYLYGIHNFDDEFEEIRITEGPLDVIIAEKYGVKNIFATLGTAFTEGHSEVIKNLGKIPVFIYDGDDAGLKAIKKAVDLMASKGVHSKILLIPNKEDMADLANRLKWDTEQYIQDNSITYGHYKMQAIVNLYDAKMNELKVKIYPEIVKILDDIPETERVVIKNYVKTKLQLDL
jgi:DNA primase